MEPRQQIQRWQEQADEAGDGATADMDVAKRLIRHGIEALDEIDRLRPDAELCKQIVDELVRQNNGLTPGWLLDMTPNAELKGRGNAVAEGLL